MALNNNDIEQIYKLVSGELDNEARKAVMDRIQSEPEMKAEHEMQKKLFEAFEKKGETELGGYLEANHSRFVRYGWWMNNKLWILAVSGAVILAAAVFTIIHENRTPDVKPVEPVNCCAFPYEEDRIQSDLRKDQTINNDSSVAGSDTFEVTPLDVVAEEVVSDESAPKIVRQAQKWEQEVPLIEIVDLTEQKFWLDQGSLKIKGVPARNIGLITYIKWAGRAYVQYGEEFYRVREESFEHITDVRLRSHLGLIKRSGVEENVRVYHHQASQSGHILAEYKEGNNNQNIKVEKSRRKIRFENVSKEFECKEVIRYGTSLYVVTSEGTYFTCPDQGTCQKVEVLPALHPYTDINIPVYVVDPEKLDALNSQ